MSSQRFPIQISDIGELDLVYEGCHLIITGLHQSIQVVDKQRRIFEAQLRALTEDRDIALIMEDSKEIVQLRAMVRDKRAIASQINTKIELVHRLQKRLSDPSVPTELIDDYQKRKKRESLMDIISGQGGM